MRQLLGQYSVSWNGQVVLDFENEQLLLPDTTALIDKHYDGLKTVIATAYSGVVEETTDDYTQVKVSFADSGASYLFRKSNKGLELIVKQPLYHKTLGEKFSERSYLLIPYFDGSSISLHSLEANFKLDVSFGTKLGYAMKPNQCNTNLKINLLQGLSLQKVCPSKLYRTYYSPSETYYIYQTDENLFLEIDPQNLKWEISISFNSSFQFFDSLISFDWNKEIESTLSPDWNVTAVLSTASDVEDISEDNSIIKEKELLLNMKDGSTAMLLEQIGLLDALKEWGDFKVLELTSSVSPLYKVDADYEELSKFVGQIGFVVDKNNLRYEIITLVDVKEDDEGNVIAHLDNYIPFKLDDVYIVLGIPVDYSARFKQSSNTFNKISDVESIVVEGTNYGSIRVSATVKINFVDNILNVLANGLTSDGKPLKDAVPALSNAFQSVELYPSTIILSLPLLPISQEDYSSTVPELNPLDYDLIDDMGKIGVLKPTYVAAPHPKGEGFIVAAKVPNYYALKIRDKLKYAPAKIFVVDEPDKALTSGAYLGTRVGSKDDYDLYLILGRVTATSKPFKVVGF